MKLLLFALLAAVLIGCRTVPEISPATVIMVDPSEELTPEPPVLPILVHDLRDAPPYDESVAQRVEAHMALMTPSQRIGQRLIVFVPRSVNLQTEAGRASFKRTLYDYQPAGVMLYPWNYETADDVEALTAYVQTIAQRLIGGRRLLICADQEGGRVAGFRFASIVRLPPARTLALHEDHATVWAAAYLNAMEMRRLGITMNLAPVVDVTDAPPRTIIGDRAWSADAQQVADYARVTVDAYRRVGVISTAKHFPGHGVTTVDSHGRLPTVDADWSALRATHVEPFAATIEAGVPAIMTAHILYPAIDPEFPATLSEQLLVRHLREELGFRGVVISDGLEMGALADEYDLDETLERALNVGVDLILLHARYQPADITARIKALIEAGRVSMERIDEGVRRVLAMKAAYGLLETPAGGTSVSSDNAKE